MDILIKSYNRVFYLDRCISSIYKFVEGDFKIKILDDGTPVKYLMKIKDKYPDVSIHRSDNHPRKSKGVEENIENGKEIDGFEIPVQLWINEVEKASPYFIITEDDVWFTRKIHVNELEKIMKTQDISLLRLGWLGNSAHVNSFQHKPINKDINAITPNLFTAPYFVMDLFFFNRYKFFSLLSRLKIVNNETKPRYWILNSIMMGIYKKEYWLEIWKNAKGTLDEKSQLLKASVYYRKNKKNENFIAQLNGEAMKTTFVSSATNSYHDYGDNFDVNRFNYIFNEKWYTDELDYLQNFPKDFTEEYIVSILDKVGDEKAASSEWKKWAEKFRHQYRRQGCEVDDN